MFAVWDDEDALNSFTDAMAPRWSRSTEHYEVRMRAASGHGAWRGVDVVGLLPPVDAEHSGPVATITRADVRLRSWSAFRRAGAPVSEELHRAPGLLAVVGIGEAPVGRLGTFALWRDHESLIAFARKMPVHRAVVQRTRTEAWYGEELFARFVPYASSGSWDGRDPLAGRLARSTGTNIP